MDKKVADTMEAAAMIVSYRKPILVTSYRLWDTVTFWTSLGYQVSKPYFLVEPKDENGALDPFPSILYLPLTWMII